MSLRYLLIFPLASALVMMVVMAYTPAPHTSLFLATILCIGIVLVGIAVLWTRRFSSER